MVSATRSGRAVGAAVEAPATVAVPAPAVDEAVTVAVATPVSAQVANILDAIKNTTTPVATVQKTQKAKKPKQPTVPRGIAKSGRPWKDVKQK